MRTRRTPSSRSADCGTVAGKTRSRLPRESCRGLPRGLIFRWMACQISTRSSRRRTVSCPAPFSLPVLARGPALRRYLQLARRFEQLLLRGADRDRFVFCSWRSVAFITGIVLTRTITHSVSELYHATQYVQAGDFTHRVRVERADQLGALADSFNAMAGSVGTSHRGAAQAPAPRKRNFHRARSAIAAFPAPTARGSRH